LKIIDIGTQPNALFTTESLFHDRILKKQLAAKGWKLREHPYRNGNDMVPYTDGRLDVMILGDIPAFIAMQLNNIGISAVIRQGHNTVIARRRITAPELKGLRVAYPFNTTAHYAIERTLNAANLTTDDIVSINLQPDEMLNALSNNIVDVIVSREPTTSIILKNIKGSAAIYVIDGYSYIAFDRGFSARNPEIQKYLLAAVLRAVLWLKNGKENSSTSLEWDRKAEMKFLCNSAIECNTRWKNLLLRETIDNPLYPMLPLNFMDETTTNYKQFIFLKNKKIIPANAEWSKICERVDLKILPAIIRDGTNFEIDHFDYSTEKLFQDTGINQ